MHPEEREALRRRFEFRCGYCGVTETEVGAELTVDHFQPRSRGGSDGPANWVYACFTCNNHKSDVWAVDGPARILHPLNDVRSEHVTEAADGTLVGVSATGRYHIERLQLNRAPLVAHRRAVRQQVELRHAVQQVLSRQEELRQRVAALEQAVADAEHRLRSL